MKKRILATILCILMLVPCFAMFAFAADPEKSPWDMDIINVAPKGKTYQTSNWNGDSSARYLNNGFNYSSWQFWRPGDEARGQGYEGVDNTRQHVGMSFNYYQTVNSVTVYGYKYFDHNGGFCPGCNDWIAGEGTGYVKQYKKTADGEFELDGAGNKKLDYIECKTCHNRNVLESRDEKNNIKYTVEILVQGQWYVAGCGYNNDMEFCIEGAPGSEKVLGGTGGYIGAIEIDFDKVFPQYDKNGDVVVDSNGDPVYTNFATTKNVRVVVSEYGAYALKGATNEISIGYIGEDVTSITHAGKTYTVTEDTELATTSNNTYISTYSYEFKDGTKSDMKIAFSINDNLGAAGFKVVTIEKEEPYYNKDGTVVRDDQGNIATQMVKYDRYFFEYDSNGKVKITQKLASHHDWWLVPIIHEVYIWGHQAVNTPRFDVPEGAEVVTDAALGGMASATTSAPNQYPLLGNDRSNTTQWIANDYENQSYWIEFDQNKDYTIGDVILNFGYMSEDTEKTVGTAGTQLVYDFYVRRNGNWELFAGGEEVTTDSAEVLMTYHINGDISGIKVTFTSSIKNGKNAPPAITDTNALISDGEQCVFLSGYLNAYRASSIAQGNLAPYGEAYCSSSFDYSNISDVTFINDGQTSDLEAFSWYAESFLKGTYCGIKLKESEDVTKVTLYFNDIILQGKPEEHVMVFDIQALVNGEYITIKEGVTSYDPVKKSSIITVVLDQPVRTNDIRIVYQANGMVFPYLKELEIYAGQKLYSAFDNYMLDTSVRTLHGRAATTDFAQKTIVKRAKYMELVAPLEFLVFATKYNLD